MFNLQVNEKLRLYFGDMYILHFQRDFDTIAHCSVHTAFLSSYFIVSKINTDILIGYVKQPCTNLQFPGK